MARALARLSASGFSPSTWQPAFSAVSVTLLWAPGTVQSNTTSGFTALIMAFRSVPVCAWSSLNSAWRFRAASRSRSTMPAITTSGRFAAASNQALLMPPHPTCTTFSDRDISLLHGKDFITSGKDAGIRNHLF